jgi:hypothetical protein
MGGATLTRAVRGAPLGLLGMLVLAAAVERQVDKNDLSFNVDSTWRYSREKARSRGPRSEILCFGSSMIKFGVLPAVIEARTGRPAYNLAVYNGRIMSSYFLFKRALEAGARPAAVVLDCMDGPCPVNVPDVLRKDIEANRPNWPNFVTAAECVEVARAAGSPTLAGELLTARFVPSVRLRFGVRRWVKAGLDGDGRRPFQHNLIVLRNWNMNRGAQVMPAGAPVTGPTGTFGPPAGPPPGLYRDNATLKTYSRKFLDLAASRGIKVFWVVPPFTPAKQLSRFRDGHLRYQLAHARAMTERYPNMVVVYGADSGYPAGTFSHEIHLNAAGNARFSDDLGAVIARHLNGGGPPIGARWADLPRFRPLTPATPAEDINRSALAVMSTPDTRRR